MPDSPADSPNLRVGMLYCKTDTKHVIGSPLEAIVKSLSVEPAPDIILAPEWFFVPEHNFYTPRQYAALRTRLKRATEGIDSLVIPGTIARLDSQGRYLNTALVLSGGETLLEYSKRTDGGDSNFAYSHQREWQDGKKKGVFRWQDYACGLEICADHGTLKGDKEASDLDFHFVVSCGMYFYDDSLCISENGLALLCDGCSSGHVIQHSQDSRNRRQSDRPDRTYPLTDDLKLYVYEVPRPGAEPIKASGAKSGSFASRLSSAWAHLIGGDS